MGRKSANYANLTTHANIKLRTILHDSMKAIRQARVEAEGADVKLSRIYAEAVEMYVSAEPQQRLLNGRKLRATG
jgi:hypothetical protein